MADTIREKIITAITTKAALIKTTTYNTNIGNNVYRAVRAIDPDNLPAVNVWPGVESSERKYGYDCISMQVDIEGMQEFGASNASTIGELILGDLKKAFATFSATGVTIQDIAYASGGVEYPKDLETAAGARVSITVKYDTLLGNPYSQ